MSSETYIDPRPDKIEVHVVDVNKLWGNVCVGTRVNRVGCPVVLDVENVFHVNVKRKRPRSQSGPRWLYNDLSYTMKENKS